MAQSAKLAKWRFEKGLVDVGPGIYAYLQPDGSWGWSNAGLVVDGEVSLLVDTLFDTRLTGEMLKSMRDAAPAARQIDSVVNTHANGDHCYGNELVADADIWASSACAEEMALLPPEQMALFVKNADQLGKGGEFLAQVFGDFHFEGIRFTPANHTFDGEKILQVGDKSVVLMEVGPAHTRGDILVHVPDDGVVFTGDILFIEGTPIMWEGPIENWIRACDKIVELDCPVVVPGHGPLTDAKGALEVKSYLEWIRKEARTRFDAGLSAADAARDIAPTLGRFASWSDAERLAVNVTTLFNEFGGVPSESNPLALFELMRELAHR